MTPLDKLRAWLGTFPGFDILSAFRVDYTDEVPGSGGLFPSGLVELARTEDIMGNITVTSQYNFGIYCVLEKAPGDDVGAAVNASWIMDFQEWVQAQSITRRAPAFGDVPWQEKLSAQNGVLYETDGEGTATYMVQLSVQFKKRFEEENKWLT